MAWKLLKLLRWATDSTKPALNSAGAVVFCTDSKRTHVNTGSGWVGLDTPPIGATYMQFPDESAPGTLWPNTTWSDISANTKLMGRVPRVEGTASSGGANAAAAFGSVQDDQVMTHVHNVYTRNGTTANSTISNGGVQGMTAYHATAYNDAIVAAPTGRVGSATRDASVTVRIFKRTA
jgi:hypothetical protein